LTPCNLRQSFNFVYVLLHFVSKLDWQKYQILALADYKVERQETEITADKK